MSCLWHHGVTEAFARDISKGLVLLGLRFYAALLVQIRST